MNLPAGSHSAYGAASRATGTPRELEYRVFSQVTGQLSRAMREDRPFSELAKALYDNQRLWTVITMDVSGEQNGLPAGLRAQLVSLAGFIRRHTQQVLRNEANPGVLVEINTAIMRGLRGSLPPKGTV